MGWARYGSPAELPGIHHRKDYLAGVDVLPDYRITCFFTDKAYGAAASRRWPWPGPGS